MAYDPSKPISPFNRPWKHEWQRPLELDRPSWDMLRFNNIYTDSRRDFRWRYCPNIEEQTLLVSTYTVMSFECADDVVSETFPLSEEGLASANEWLQKRFRDWANENESKYPY